MNFRVMKILLMIICIGFITLSYAQENQEEEISSVEYDSATGNYILKYGPASNPITVIYEMPNKVNPTVNASVEYAGDGIYQYRYKLYNGKDSVQKLYAFEIGYWQSVISAEAPDIGWYSRNYAFKPVWRWADTEYQREGIPSGQSLEGFSLKAHGLPGIVKGYFQGYVKMTEFKYEPPEAIDDALHEIAFNADKSFVSRKTLGPTAPPADFKPVSFIDYIISMKHEAFKLGWITDKGIENSLDAKLDDAKKKIEQGNIDTAKNILEAFLNEVEAQKDKHLTSEAYGLLKYNVEYLIGRL